MRTVSRLEKVYQSAHIVEFNDESKFVFFSDTHRGDDGLSDDFGRNKHIYNFALSDYYKKGFTYVEVGDGDELLERPKFEHIRNAHVSTFNRLKKFYDDGRFYMLFGNHNIKFKDQKNVEETLYRVYDEYEDEYVDLFPGITVYEALILEHSETGQRIFVVHGHQGDLFSDQLAPVSHFGIRFLWRFMHRVGFRYAASPAKSRQKRHKVEKNYTKWNKDHGEIIICGHTHRPRFPRPDEGSYFNTGCCMHPRGITCIELEGGKLSLVAWRVHTNDEGMMYIRKTVLMGPSDIRSYDNAGAQPEERKVKEK